MMITNLPRDLVEEIFSRVPLKSLGAVTQTCREWDALSKSRISTYTKMHIGEASAATKVGGSLMIVRMGYSLNLMSVFVNNDVDSSSERKGKLACLDEQVKISKVFHCDGLLLCILKDDDTKVVVWNPFSGQTRWIELRYSLHPRMFSNGGAFFGYALGHENKRSCRSYKFLRFIDLFLFGNKFVWYEIYDFDSDSWTTLDVTPYWNIMFQDGVSLKGNTYWCASEKKSDGSYIADIVDYIICFDYTRERFGPRLPLPLVECSKSFVTISCVREEKLAVIFQHDHINPDTFEIWITTMVEAEKVSWSKFLKATISHLHNPLSHAINFFIDEVKKVVIFFYEGLNYHTVNIVGEAGHLKQVYLEESTEERCWPQVISYVPSLVQMKKPRGGQRKNQSNLEKLRYDQYMLRLSFFISRCIKLADEYNSK